MAVTNCPEQKRTRWYFDPVASNSEILFRRIGRNELETIEVCRELVSAQNEYHAEPRDGVRQYAPGFIAMRANTTVSTGRSRIASRRVPSAVADIGKTPRIRKRNNQTTAISRLLLPHPEQAGKTCARWAKNYVVNGKMTGASHSWHTRRSTDHPE